MTTPKQDDVLDFARATATAYRDQTIVGFIGVLVTADGDELSIAYGNLGLLIAKAHILLAHMTNAAIKKEEKDAKSALVAPTLVVPPGGIQ